MCGPATGRVWRASSGRALRVMGLCEMSDGMVVSVGDGEDP